MRNYKKERDWQLRKYDQIRANIDREYGNDDWELVSNPKIPEIELVYRYNNWYKVSRTTQEVLDRMKKEDGAIWLADYIVKDVEEKGEHIEYDKMQKLRFGCADYYYDWKF